MAACSPSPPSPGVAAPARPAGVVHRFLDAAGRGDHATMAALFGTASGPLGGRGGLGCALRRLGSWLRLAGPCSSFADVERRMAVVAALLSGSVAREVREASPAASASASADGSIRLLAVVDLADGGAARVPFVVVRTAAGAWLVREIVLDGLVGDGPHAPPPTKIQGGLGQFKFVNHHGRIALHSPTGEVAGTCLKRPRFRKKMQIANSSTPPPPPHSIRELARQVGVELDTSRRHWRADVLCVAASRSSWGGRFWMHAGGRGAGSPSA